MVREAGEKVADLHMRLARAKGDIETGGEEGEEVDDLEEKLARAKEHFTCMDTLLQDSQNSLTVKDALLLEELQSGERIKILNEEDADLVLKRKQLKGPLLDHVAEISYRLSLDTDKYRKITGDLGAVGIATRDATPPPLEERIGREVYDTGYWHQRKWD